MSSIKILITSLLMLAFTTIILFSQNAWEYKSLNDMVPPDPSVTLGKLNNGLTYYIKQNKKPENRVELFLVIKAGAILEDDDQKGLAHFCEHMAFNGTKNFPKMDLVNFLESTGVRFGADLNAFTSWDQTVYMLTLPTDKSDLMEKGFDVLEDWANHVTFEDEEIDKERGVILEEWRLGKGADDRVMKKHYPIMFYNSKYAERDVIGDTNIIKHAPYDALKRFYKDWYRPDLMAVIVVGDIDKAEIEKKIKDHFSNLKNPDKPRPRTEYTLPPHKDVLVSVASDKELSFPRVTLTFKHEGRKQGDYNDYRQNVVASLLSGMLNQRLQELIRKSDPPFNLFAFGSEGNYVGNIRAFNLIAGAKGDKILDAIDALFTEAIRMKQHGFTATELERQKKESLRSMESMFNEKDKTESKNYAFEFMRNFTDGESFPGIEAELELYKKWLPDITLDEINKLAAKLVRSENAVFTVSAPDREDVKVPTEKEVLALFNDISKKQTSPYVDVVSSEPLFKKKLTPGTIKSVNQINEIGVTEWTLSNGAKVVLKPTNFKNDQVLFACNSWGGTSVVPDNDFYSAMVSDDIINESGIGNFDQNKLEKLLAGKIVSLNARIYDLYEALTGQASPEDLETLFQLIYLKFAEPRVDMEAFKSYLVKTEAQLKDGHNNPRSVFFDSVRAVMGNYNFRAMPIKEENLKQISFDKIYDLYSERFDDASDFTFFFVGSFDLEKIKPFILKYIATLPSKNKKETWKDIGINPPLGKVTKEVKKGIEAQSTVRLVIHGDFDWTFENRYQLESMIEVFRIRLREALREDKGGVYGVGASGSPELYPKSRYTINVFFGCDPQRVDELIKTVMDIIEDMKKNKPEDKYLVKVKEIQKREREVNLKENNFWMNALQSYYRYNENPKLILEKNKMIDKLTADDILKSAKKYFNTDNFMKFVLNPEK